MQQEWQTVQTLIKLIRQKHTELAYLLRLHSLARPACPKTLGSLPNWRVMSDHFLGIPINVRYFNYLLQWTLYQILLYIRGINWSDNSNIKVPVCKQCRTSDLGVHCLPMSTLRDATVGTSGKYPPYLRCSDLFTGQFLWQASPDLSKLPIKLVVWLNPRNPPLICFFELYRICPLIFDP